MPHRRPPIGPGSPGRRTPRFMPGAGLALAIILALCTVAPGRALAGRPYENLEDPPYDPLRGEPARAETTDVQHVVSDTLLTLRLTGDTLVVPYFGNLRVDESHPGITRAVVVVHGTLRNARDYYLSIHDAAAAAPGADSTSIIIAPQFLAEADVAADTLSSRYLFWSYMGWRQGDNSLNTVAHPRPARISSFAVTDSILLRLAATCPDLSEIVVTGHSAGGQFTNRYAAGNPVHESLLVEFGITVRYVVSNPSSYLYFDSKRWIPGSDLQFAVPYDQLASCPNYDKYKYGLLAPNEYMNVGSAVLRGRYSSRAVTYLLGGNDIDPNNTYLEKNCEAMVQGEYRLQRGLIYRAHLADTFGPGVLDRHLFAVVPGIAHDQRGIYLSTCGIHALFGTGTCAPNLPNPTWRDRTTTLLRVPNGRGISWGDYNGDGRPDLYVSAIDGSDKLLRNGPGGVFADATVPALADAQIGASATWTDYDDDGHPDLFLVNWRGTSRLCHNEGNGSFTDHTSAPLGANGDFTESDWADFDRDGDLDAVLVRETKEGNLLLRNDGNGVFTNVTPPALADTFATRDASWTDLDVDGDPDLYLVYADGRNRLLRNDGGTFTEATPPGLDDLRNGASACWGDYDNDGDLDLYLVKRGAGSKLLRNDGPAGFTDVTTFPLNLGGMGRTASWGDYDNDGDLDLYVVFTGAKNHLFRNEGAGAFTDVTDYPINDQGLGWSVAWADYDGDGRLDLGLGNEWNWNKLFLNENGGSRHWLELDLHGVQSNSGGVGARVRVVAGGKVMVREVGSDQGSLSQNWSTVHFGLGAATTIDSLVISWPSGIVQREVPGFPADRRLTITESDQPAGAPNGPPAAPIRIVPPAPNPFTSSTAIVLELPGAGPATARIFDPAGRLVRTILDGAPLPAGCHRLAWDGRDARGHAVAPGVYFCRVEAGGESGEFRLVRTR